MAISSIPGMTKITRREMAQEGLVESAFVEVDLLRRNGYAVPKSLVDDIKNQRKRGAYGYVTPRIMVIPTGLRILVTLFYR